MFFNRTLSADLEGKEEVSIPQSINVYPQAQAENDGCSSLREYLQILKQAEQTADKNNFDEAKILLTTLSANCPHYPEVYVALGDLYKIVNRELAVKYYFKAVELCPFDYYTYTKLALLGNGPLKDSFKNEEYFKRKEDDFVKKHQQALRLRLTILGKINVTQLDALAASKDAFYGLTAKVNKHISLAQHYFRKAIVQFEHDYLAKIEYALVRTDVNYYEEAIIELNKIGEEYHYCGAYLYLYKIYRKLKNYDLARQNLVNFLSIAQRDDLDEVIYSREEMAEFLEFNVFDENEVKKHKVFRRFDLKAIMSSPTRLGISFEEMVKQILTTNNPLILEELNFKILQYPGVATLYKCRARYYQHEGMILAAALDYTMAVWYSKKEECIDYYLERYTAHLINGNPIQAQFDFFHLKKLGEETNGASQTLLTDKLSKDASLACYSAGNEYLNKNKFLVAENIFRLGIKIKPSLNMYLDCSKAMKRGGKSSEDIVEMLEHALKKAILKKSELIKFNSVYHHFLNLKQKEIGGRDRFLINFNENDFESYDKPALEHDSNVNITFIVLNIALLTVTVIFALLIYKRLLRTQPQPRLIKAKNDTNQARNNLPKKKPLSTPRKANTTSHIKLLLSENEMVELTTAEDSAADQKDHNKILQDKKKIKKLREKGKKLEVRNQRKCNRFYNPSVSSESNLTESYLSETEDGDTRSLIPSIDKDELRVDLNDFENKIFTLLYSSVPEDDRTKYRTYLVGGWAYDKVREKKLGIAPCTYNDADLTTEILPEILSKNFYQIPEVPGLFFSKLDEVKIDIMYEPDLSNLLRDAKSRDFLTLYIDEQGKISDPTGFALINLLSKHLSGVNAPADMFKEDPLVMLRAIYLATKRDLKINSLRKIIKTDRHLLVPRLTNLTSREERLLQPRRFNLRFAKLFTQHLASKNLQLLKSLGILAVLFPDIYPELQTNFNWLTAQTEITSAYVWPKIAIIYANFIACAVVLRVPEIELAHLPAKMFPSTLQTTVHNIWSNSLLFQDTFADPDNLYSFLKRPLQEWKNNIGSKLHATETVFMNYR